MIVTSRPDYTCLVCRRRRDQVDFLAPVSADVALCKDCVAVVTQAALVAHFSRRGSSIVDAISSRDLFKPGADFPSTLRGLVDFLDELERHPEWLEPHPKKVARPE